MRDFQDYSVATETLFSWNRSGCLCFLSDPEVFCLDSALIFSSLCLGFILGSLTTPFFLSLLPLLSPCPCRLMTWMLNWSTLLTTCCLLQLPMAGPTTYTPTHSLRSVSSTVTGRLNQELKNTQLLLNSFLFAEMSFFNSTSFVTLNYITHGCR